MSHLKICGDTKLSRAEPNIGAANAFWLFGDNELNA